ncbi:hypothetical protein WICPIJ_002297, partial [Wickerhamomyces pijperi]
NLKLRLIIESRSLSLSQLASPLYCDNPGWIRSWKNDIGGCPSEIEVRSLYVCGDNCIGLAGGGYCCCEGGNGSSFTLVCPILEAEYGMLLFRLVAEKDELVDSVGEADEGEVVDFIEEVDPVEVTEVIGLIERRSVDVMVASKMDSSSLSACKLFFHFL